MKNPLIRSLFLLALLSSISFSVYGQTGNSAKAPDTNAKPAEAPVETLPVVAVTATASPIELAKAALVAQGGDKFRALKSTVLRGSVDLYGPNSTQSVPGGFVLVTSGDKIRMEVDARPLFTFKQIFDGQQSYSSLPGAEMAPLTKFGMRLLTRFQEPGFTVTALPDKKKQRGFRIADAEGNATDFYLDSATGRVVSYTFAYNANNFGPEHKKIKEVEGVLIPSSFTQRIEMPQGAAFAEFSVKDIKLNQPLGDDVFAMPN